MKKKRCSWVPEGDTLYEEYHDKEWGVPVKDDIKLFEFLILESAQAGLSWRTILEKRGGYRKHFANFNPKKVAKFTKGDINRLVNLKSSEIIRNRAKIEATVINAQQFLEVQKEFGTFSRYQWSFVGRRPIKNRIKNEKDYRPTSPESDKMAKDMRERGFKFLGSTTLYAHMQAVGMVDDHMVQCFKNK